MSLWDAFYGRKLRHWSGISLAILLTAVFAGLDLCVGRLNYGVGYLLPLIAIAPLRRRRLLYGSALTLVSLIYVLYIVGPFVRMGDHLHAAFDFRLFNRTMAACVVLGAALGLDAREYRLNAVIGRTSARGSARFDRFLVRYVVPLTRLALSKLAALSLAGFGLIALADCLLPARYNPSILFALIIVICACTPHRLLLWSLVLFSLLLSRVGFLLGPSPPPPALVPYFLLNRLFVSLCAVSVALLTAPWIAWQEMDQEPVLNGGNADETNGSDFPDAAHRVVESSRPPASGGNRRRKRILYLDHTAAIGGGEIALINLVQHLDRSRYEPVVALFANGPLVAMLRSAGIETHLLPLPHSVVNVRKESLHGWGLLRVGDMVQTLGHVGRLARFMRAGRFDLIHANSLKSDIIGGLAARIAGRTILWHVRDRIDPDYLPRQAVAGFRAACCLFADFVVTNSRATMGLLRPTFGDVFGNRAAKERMRVVHDGVIGQAFIALKKPISDSVSIGLVGRISPFKGQDVFIKAAANVLGRYPNCQFKIIGAALFNEVDYERDIRRSVKELHLEHAVEFTGFRNDVMQAISDLDILVHASVTGEPFGQVIVEGMAAGKPIVATNGGGVPEIVDEGITGLLVPMNDANALANAICRLLSDPAGATDMGLRGRERVHQHFRIENTASKVERFYRYIFARRRKPGLGPTRTPRRGALSLVMMCVWVFVFAELVYSTLECVYGFESLAR